MDKLNGVKINILLILIVLIGFILRIVVSLRGYNYDFESWYIVANLAYHGLNVYADTNRYTTGPGWFTILHILYDLASTNVITFRYLIVCFLSFMDVGIFLILYKKIGRIASFIFFLNPISIIITGYHNQFDNIAVFLGMMSILIIGDNFDKPITLRKSLGLMMLGLSMIVKHVFFAFPIWLVVKQKGLASKLLTAFLPWGIFLLGFMPYWQSGSSGIINNVFLYKSFNNEIFYHLFIPESLQKLFSSTVVWIIFLIIFAFIFRRKNSYDSLLLYTCVLVAISPAIANQYLVIAIPFVSTFINPYTLCYTLVGSFYLSIDGNGLHLNQSQNASYYNTYPGFYYLLVILLCLGLVRSFWYNQIVSYVKRIWLELKIQFS